MKLWDLAIRQPVFMTMILAAGVVLGSVAFFRMPVNLFPEVEFPVVLVTTVYPGASPEEIEDQITSVLEEELNSVNSIETITSQSSEGVSTIIMQFSLDASVDKVSQDVRDKVNLMRNELPRDIQEPIVRRFNPSDSPIMLFGVADATGQLSSSALRTLVEETVQTPLQGIEGVAAVDVNGGEEREIQVHLDLAALEARRIAPQQVIGALQTENVNVPAGALSQGDQEFLVRTTGSFEEIEEIRELDISQRGPPVYLRDVATVTDGFKERETITRLNGEESIVVSVRKQSGTNTLAVSDAVKDALVRIGTAQPTLEIVIAGDEADIVSESTNGALEDLLWSALLATLVILFFFRDLRNTLITMAGLPVILIATVFFMDLLDISLNQISLLALALVVGLVIDDGIVVRENIMRWIEKGYRPAVAASKGTAEVIIPVLATSATILAVFLPVAYAEGIIGKFFRDFGLTVSLAIIVSTFEALTMAPMLSAYFFKAKDDEDEDMDVDEQADGSTLPSSTEELDEIEETLENAGEPSWLERVYGAILNWTLDHKIIALFLTAVVIAGSVYSVQFIEQSFLPSLDRGQFDASLEFPPGTPLTVTEREALKVESIIRSHPLIADVFTTIGGTGSPERATFFVKVVELERGKVDTRAVIDDLRAPLAGVPNMSFQLADSATGGDVLLGGKDVIMQMSASGRSYEELVAAGRAMVTQLEQIEGITDIDVSFNPGKPELQLDIDRTRIADFGLSTAQIGSSVRTLVNGEIVSTFRGSGPEAEIRVQLAEQYRNDAETLLDITLLNPSGALVPLRSVATVRESSGPSQILRIDRLPTITIGANIFGRPQPETQGDVNELLATMALPSGITAKLAGDAEAQEDAFTNLGLAMLLAIVFIYMVLASQFASYVQPLLIMLAMPLAIIGAILALFATSKPLDLTAFIGFIMLMGLVTKNSILLVDFANRARARGASADEAMRLAGPVRLRPILMTALSLILAMVPVASGLSQGGEFRQSMSIAIMGGMTTSTFLTLVVVPLAYSIVVGFLDRVSARVQARRDAKRAARRAERRAALEREPEDALQVMGD